MNKFFVLAALALVFAQVVLSQTPSPPVWPNQFQIAFNETTKIIFSHSTTGKLSYDYDKKTYRIDRANGKNDRYCGSIQNKDEPCSHLVTPDGNRYLILPKSNYCCMCCTQEKGCGVLVPNWLNGAQYLGTETLSKRECQKWNKPGLQNNYYYNTNDDKQIPVKLDQQPNDVMYYDVDSYKSGPGSVDPATFELPSYCSAQKLCGTLICKLA